MRITHGCTEFCEESHHEIAMLEKNLYSWKELYDESNASIAYLRNEKVKLLVECGRLVDESKGMKMEIEELRA